MYKVGITGGIGSGKTTVSKLFAELGVPVYYADDEAKKLTNESVEVKDALISLIGSEVYNNQGVLDRKLLASKIFSNKQLLQKVNAIIHPAVAEHFILWTAKQEAPYILKEAAILFETGSYKQLDATILVTASEELRVKRVMSRDGVTKEEVEKRMANQWEEERKIPLADYIITNNSTREVLVKEIAKVHEDIISRANS